MWSHEEIDQACVLKVDSAVCGMMEINQACVLKRIGTSVRRFENPLVYNFHGLL